MDTRHKQIAYAEGLRHGFDLARRTLEEQFSGFMTIPESETITRWEKRANRLKVELEDERHEKRNAK